MLKVNEEGPALAVNTRWRYHLLAAADRLIPLIFIARVLHVCVNGINTVTKLRSLH